MYLVHVGYPLLREITSNTRLWLNRRVDKNIEALPVLRTTMVQYYYNNHINKTMICINEKIAFVNNFELNR